MVRDSARVKLKFRGSTRVRVIVKGRVEYRVLMYSLDIFLNHFLSLPMSLRIFPFMVWETGTSWDMGRIRGMGRGSASVRIIGRVGSRVRIVFMYS